MAIQTKNKKPGRKRDTQVDHVILVTTLRLLIEQGYASTSIEKIANDAGVGKTSIYRRYKDKKDLLAAAVSYIIQDVELPPDTGDTRIDLIGALLQFRNHAQSKGLYQLIGTLIAEANRDPELIRLFRAKVIEPRLSTIENILQRGIDRSEIKPDINIHSVIDALFGAFITRFLIGKPDDVAWVASIVDVIWYGISS